MQGAPKRQVNAEEMLAELKRVLDSSTRAPDAPPPSASPAARSRSPDRESSRSQTGGERDRPAKTNASKSIGWRTDLQKSTWLSSRSRKLIARGLALAGAAAICVGFAFMNRAPDLAEREPPVAATESPARPQNKPTLEPSSSPELGGSGIHGGPAEPSPRAGGLAQDRAGRGANCDSALPSRFARFGAVCG